MATHSVSTPGKADRLVVDIKTDGIVPVADGSDMIPVYFKVCDKNGSLIYNSGQEIRILVSGEGVLVGDTISRIGINPQKVEGGVGFAFVRTTKRQQRVCSPVKRKSARSRLKGSLCLMENMLCLRGKRKTMLW